MSLNDLDKFTRFFVQKAVQVIVQSRLGGDRVRTRCNPRASDWFNLSIPDDKEVTDRTRRCFDTIAAEWEGRKLTVTKGWQVCCEVSLKNSSGECMVLESWLMTNEPLGAPRTKASIASDQVFTLSNRLTLLLKSIITLTRSTPIHKLSASGQGPDTFVICYRIFDTEGCIEDLIEEKDRSRYSRPIKLGSVSSQFNRLSVSFAYRTNMSTCGEDRLSQAARLMPVKTDHFKSDATEAETETDFSRSRKILAFASPKSRCSSFLLRPCSMSLLCSATTIRGRHRCVTLVARRCVYESSSTETGARRVQGLVRCLSFHQTCGRCCQ